MSGTAESSRRPAHSTNCHAVIIDVTTPSSVAAAAGRVVNVVLPVTAPQLGLWCACVWCCRVMAHMREG